LVTGCAGFIGSHLSESLLGDGHSVLGIDRLNDNYGRAQKLDNLEQARDWEAFEFVHTDLARGGLTELVEGCDAIFHLAAEPGVRASWGERFELYLQNNVLATQQLLEAARAFPGKRFVYASSSSVYGEAASLPTLESATPRPLSPYGMTKLGGEHLCDLYRENHGVDTVALRYFSVYGPRQRPDMAFNIFCHATINGEPVTVFGDGGQRRDFTFVSDIVAATRSAAERGAPGAVYNVGGGASTSLMAALEIIGELAGQPVSVEHRPSRRGDARETAADTTLAALDLDYAPRTGLAEGIEAELEWVLGRQLARRTDVR
jgi:nucleoside-diphosphate-sugar epimerase